MSSLKHNLRKLIWRFGYDISRFSPLSHPIAKKRRIFNSHNFDVVIDIGANVGQFSQHLREDIGYKKRILSFEPLSSAFTILKSKARYDSYWDVFNIALGDVEENKEINIAGNSDSSSLLSMLPYHLKMAPESKFVGKEMVQIKRLDTIFNDLCNPSEKIFMKIDTQGYENRVLIGAENSLKHIDAIQIEMSLVPLYNSELLFHQIYIIMNELGYELISIEPAFLDPKSGQLLQIDGIFSRI